MSQPNVKTIFDPRTFTATHIVWDPATREAAIIDSVLDFDQPSGRTSTEKADEVMAFVVANDLAVRFILETHAHADHLSAAPYLKEITGAIIAIGDHISTVQSTFGDVFNEPKAFARDGSQFDRLLKDGETFQIGKLTGRVIYTPGHTPACVSYLIGDAVFVGDTLFMPDYGSARCDFPGGDAATLYRSVHRLYELPDTTRMFLCHDYLAPMRDNFVWETTIGEQKRANIHLNTGISEAEFVAMRNKRDATLGMPQLILPSIQVNMRAGHFPPPESNGIHYLKVPLNLL